jgi:dGTPase
LKLGDGPFGLKVLADGSLVDEARYGDRYSRATGNTIRNPDTDRRTETERDRGRVEYSSYIRRLSGVTQVIPPDLAAAAMHSRASHTHKVAMVAREIADNLVRRAWDNEDFADVIRSAGGLDIAACEAAGLAHDLGHPPFGHAGESALDKALRVAEGTNGLSRTEDGFEGNAQSFRIVAVLDHNRGGEKNHGLGLDLTNVTLAAILKYPFTRREPFEKKKNRKFGAYRVDGDALKRVRSAILNGAADEGQQTLEASVMDLADDIAYAVHDLEDFFAAGAIDARAVLTKLDDAITNAKIETHIPGRADGDVNISWKFTNLIEDEDPFTKEARELRAKYETYFNDEKFGKALQSAQELLGGVPDFTHPDDVLDLRTNLNRWVDRFFAQLQLSAVPPYPNGPLVFLDSEAWHEIQALKVITSHFVVSTPRMGMLQRAQSKTVKLLVERLAEWLLAFPKEHELPIALRRVMDAADVAILVEPAVDEAETNENPLGTKAATGADENSTKIDAPSTLTPGHYRAIADYICTMSDSEALLRAQWLSGTDHPGTSVSSIWA